MIPGMPNIDPKKMQAMMKQMGIHQEDIPATKVTIETDDKTISIHNPSVQKIKMAGNESFQITGDIQESETEKFSQEDIQMIVNKTGKSEEEARTALEETNDIAEAIIKLSE